MNKHQNPNNFIENETQTDDTNSNESQLKVERIVICFVSRATLQGYFEIDVTNVSIKTAHSVAPFHSFHITHYALCLPSLLFILVIFARFLSFFSCLLRASNLSKKRETSWYDESATCLDRLPHAQKHKTANCLSERFATQCLSFLSLSCYNLPMPRHPFHLFVPNSLSDRLFVISCGLRFWHVPNESYCQQLKSTNI